MKLIVLAISLVIFIGCSAQQEKQQAGKSNQKSAENIKVEQKLSESIEVSREVGELSAVMSSEEAAVLEMNINAYEENANDLINWSAIAAEASNVDQANEAITEYIEVQKRFNEKIKEIEAFSVKTLGADYTYSVGYEAAFKNYLADPVRTQRTKNAVGATMRLIDQYGHDKEFNEKLKELGEMNKHKMKELDQ